MSQRYSLCIDDDTNCQTLDLNCDVGIDFNSCANEEQCITVDWDADGSVDDLYCYQPDTGCETIDLDSDGAIEEDTCNVQNEECIGVDSNSDGIVDFIDCSNTSGCVGVDFSGDGLVDVVVCDPNP